MKQKHITNNQATAINLSAEEYRYLKNIEPVIICPDPDWAPYEYKDAKGKYSGISAEIISLIFKRLSLKYEILWARNWKEVLSLSKAGNIHLIPFLNKTPEREKWLNFTNPVFVDPNVFVSRLDYPYIDNPDDLYAKNISLPEGTAVETVLKDKFPGLNIITTKSEIETFQLVADGKADLTLRSLMVAAYTIGVNQFTNLKIAGQMPDFTNHLCIGVIHAESLLKDILNKAIHTISPEDQTYIVNKHVNSKLAASNHSLSAQMMLAVTFMTASNWYWIYRLQVANERYQILLDHMQTHVWYLQDEFTYVTANQPHANFLGVQKQDLERKKVIEIQPKELAEIQADNNQKVFSEQVALNTEDWMVNNNGEKRLLAINRTPLIDSRGKVEYVVCAATDITDKRKMEQKLFFEKEQFRTTLLSVSDGVISTDTRGFIAMINEAAIHFTGWSQGEAVGQNLKMVLPLFYEDTLKPFTVSLDEIKEKDEISLSSNIALITKKGTQYSIEGSIAAIRDKSNKFSGTVIVFRDVTEKRLKTKQNEYFSFRDPLTGLYNRRYFEEELNRLDVPRNLPLTILLVDINGLKLANDAFGHQAGDNLLDAIAKGLQEACRQDDILARIGGDEFVILLPSTSREQAIKLNQRIVNVLSGQEVMSIPLSVSCGIGSKIKDNQLINTVFKSAEMLMYKQKISDRKNHRRKALANIQSRLFSLFPEHKFHSQKVGRLSGLLAKEFGLKNDDVKKAIAVGELHDLGKVALDPGILKKKTSFTEDELSEFRRHPDIGFNIMLSIAEYAALADSILAHHENWDGSGYPNELMESDIPIFARIVSITDAYDTMIRNWPDRPAMDPVEAKNFIKKEAGKKFDPQLVDIFLKIV